MMVVPKKKLREWSLTGRIDMHQMKRAFKAVKRNRGAAGVDKQSIEMFEGNLQENLERLMYELKRDVYVPLPLRRHYIPKEPDQWRPLGIPTVRCRVAQEVARRVLAVVFDPLFHSSSHGFIRRRSCHTAMREVREVFESGLRWVVKIDIAKFFDNIPHEIILGFVEREISDGTMIRLVKKFLRAGVMEEGKLKPTVKGTPQGGVISPLLANLVLNHLDWTLERHGIRFVRYADDAVAFASSRDDAEKALEVIRQCVEGDLGLLLHPEKTRITRFADGFNFLGFHVTSQTITMSEKAIGRFKDKVREITTRCHNLDAKVVERLNQVIRGTVYYFSADFSSTRRLYRPLDAWIRRRIRCMKYKRFTRTDNCHMTNAWIANLGIDGCRDLEMAMSR
jgi:RNA-directed DNA polymerase